MRYEIRLSGSGGQGLILAGLILSEAAGIHRGWNVVQTQSYGPESRGGASRSDIIISDEEIDYPETEMLDVLIAMNQASLDIHIHYLKDSGLLLVDSTLVSQPYREDAVCIPFTQIAKERFNNILVANMIAIGSLAHVLKRYQVNKRLLFTINAIEKAISTHVPQDMLEANLKALHKGIKIFNKSITYSKT
ncbi:MAG: 2-oxoacid:acceptor oxidoreductase family protein [Nitrospirota bacterium]